MFHLTVFSFGIYKQRKSKHYLLPLAIFHELEMTQFWSVKYICLVYKSTFSFWTYLKFWAILWQIFSHCIAVFLVLLEIAGAFSLCFFDRKCFKVLYLCFPFIKKPARLVLKNCRNSEVVGRRKLCNPSFSNIFNRLSISLRYTFSFEWPNFDLKHLITVMRNSQPPNL